MGISFRRRRKVNWLAVALLLVLLAAGAAVIVQSTGVPAAARDLPFMPKTPTPTPVPVDDGSVLMALADGFWQQGRLDDATTAYQEAAAAALAGADLLVTVAADYAGQDRLADAAISRFYAAQAKTRAALAHARLARILAIRGWNPAMTAQAVEQARKALAIDPANGEALAVLALAYDRDGKYDAAIEAGREAVAKDGKNAEAYAFLAEAYADKLPMDPRAKEAAQNRAAAQRQERLRPPELWLHPGDRRRLSRGRGRVPEGHRAVAEPCAALPGPGPRVLCQAGPVRGRRHRAAPCR